MADKISKQRLKKTLNTVKSHLSEMDQFKYPTDWETLQRVMEDASAILKSFNIQNTVEQGFNNLP